MSTPAASLQTPEDSAVADAALSAGFASLFAASGKPHEDDIRMALIESPLGRLIAGAHMHGLVLLEFAERRRLDAQCRALRRHFAGELVAGENPHLAQLRRELAAYFSGQLRRFEVPLLMPASGFQQAVWKALCEIPYGETTSYAALAQTLGRPDACRAVGTANGQNRLAIVVPCHRVINKSGALGGYGGGLWRKQRLLALEAESRGDLLF